MVGNDKIYFFNFVGQIDRRDKCGDYDYYEHDEKEQNDCGITFAKHKLNGVAQIDFQVARGLCDYIRVVDDND